MSAKPAVRPVQPSLPELLEHATFLRRLAARLVGPDGAEDVVQEAFATALARPPSRASLRGWLAVVVANLARRERRSAERRATREARAARPEQSNDSTIALERLDLQRALSAYVVALPEEQRTVLYLRYFEDLTPSAIAARLEVPLKTIESRHTRALASLRAKLDERSGGDRAAWVSAMAAWAKETGAGLGVVLAAAAGVLLCGGAWLAWRGFVAERPEAVGKASEVAGTSPAAPDETREVRRETLESAPVAPMSVGSLEGVALALEDRQPIAGLALHLTLGDGKAELTTDEQGRFRYASDVPRRLIQLELAAGPRTIPLERKLGQRLERGETIELELLVPSGATLAGTVVDENGAPVTGATVIGHCVEWVYGERQPERVVTTGPDGSFVVEHLGESFRLTAEAPGLACQEGFHGKVAAGTRGDGLVLRVAPELTFRGEVVDADGLPVEGAKVSGSNSSSSYTGDGTHVLGVHRLRASAVSGSSDASGRFELGPSAEGSMNLRASKRGFLDQDVRGDAGNWNRIVLDRGLSLSGLVGDDAGVPLDGVHVILRGDAQGQTTTDEHGHFRIGALEAAENSFLLATKPGFAIGVIQPVPVAENAPEVEQRLDPEWILAGRVLDEDGRPVADAELRIEGDREVVYHNVNHGERTTWEWAAGLNKTRTDEDGRFRFAQLYGGTFDLYVTPAEGPAVALPFRVRSGDQTLELAVTREQRLGVVFTGRVIDALTGQPVPRFQISLNRPSGRPERTSEELRDGITIRISVHESWNGRSIPVENETGDYLLSGNAPGRAYLGFEAPGYFQGKLEPREYALGVSHGDVRLIPARQVQFVLGDGDRPADASLRFRDANGASVRVGTGLGSWDEVLSIRRDPPVAATLPRIPLQVTASAYNCTDFEFTLEAEREGAEPVVVSFPQEKHRSIVLQIYESEDASLTTGSLDLQTLREALLDGVITLPRDPVGFEFLGSGDKTQLRAELTPLGGENYKQVVSYFSGSGGNWSESEGDASLHLSTPESVRRVTLVSPGCRPLTFDLDLPGPWPERPQFRVIVLERQP